MWKSAGNFRVIVACDATKDIKEQELQLIIDNMRMRGDILGRGDTLLILGVLHSLPHPMGYQTKPCLDSLFGTNARALEDEVSKKVDVYVNMLHQSAAQCQNEGVHIEVKITAGTPAKKVILQEAVSCKSTWVIIDRHLRKDMKFFTRNIPCKVALIYDSLSVEVVRSFLITSNEAELSEQKFYSLSRSVEPILNMSVSGDGSHTVVSYGSYSGAVSSQDSCYSLRFSSLLSPNHIVAKQRSLVYHESSSSNQEKPGNPILCVSCGPPYILELMKFKLSEIQAATSDFSRENLLGEGGFGHVYKGRLKDGHVIAAKIQKQESSQGYPEFCSEVHILTFARHKNIVMLLGYCSEENRNILVYEYLCNKSLEWHLSSKSAPILEWHRRFAIAIGTAKGLRFLHEECRGGPIVHRDLRPSNILLTHDFIPMIGDFGLAKWKTNVDQVHTRVLGTLGYLAPEYVENGIVSVRTDVYAFGIVLLQLISGRKVVDIEMQGQQQSLLQLAEPLIEKLALHELIDSRLGDSYDTYELYHMAKAAYLCVRRKPEMRPSMAEVIHLLEGANELSIGLEQQFMFSNIK
ncbi:probable serine/threonine-protein kinase PBL8 [Aristolochia californica]|uniref:probable serine/threonine-protein kinase PBL8 n=1 Tax=Aristolochia californica TaxID=171875 RepID=UPI0035DD8C7E